LRQIRLSPCSFFPYTTLCRSKLDQWARWRDERLLLAQRQDAAASVPATGQHAALPFAAPNAALTPPPGVAKEGRRLKRGSGWTADRKSTRLNSSHVKISYAVF